LAERIREQIARAPFVLDGTEIAVTTSIGVVEARQGDDIRRLLALGDAALYRAKAKGRNCVETEARAELAADSN